MKDKKKEIETINSIDKIQKNNFENKFTKNFESKKNEYIEENDKENEVVYEDDELLEIDVPCEWQKEKFYNKFKTDISCKCNDKNEKSICKNNKIQCTELFNANIKKLDDEEQLKVFHCCRKEFEQLDEKEKKKICNHIKMVETDRIQILNLKEKMKNEFDIKWNSLDQYIKALTHLSYINERKLKFHDSYERLEFFGDSIIQFTVSKELYKNSKLEPGHMTLMRSKIVRKETLANIAVELGFEDLIKVGNGEKRRRIISDSVLEDTMEAFVAAIYIDVGLDAAIKFVEKFIAIKINDFSFEDLKDPKTRLQEYLQKIKSAKIYYHSFDSNEKENGKVVFISQVIFDNHIVAWGKGLTKKEAEMEAAKAAWEKFAPVEKDPKRIMEMIKEGILIADKN